MFFILGTSNKDQDGQNENNDGNGAPDGKEAPDGKGGYRYAVSARMPKLNFEEKLQTIFRECVLSAENAQNLAIIKTMNGMANAAAFALDSMEDTDIVGTLAGDDTVLLVFHDSAHAADFCEQVRLMLH